MASLIPGFEYDIFISYRQKDNKGEHWITEFVNSLKTELESTFKEDVSIYFDENSHDGLLDTHDVDDSLKEKLKCLILIPIISQTYCDPKSFAWNSEFLAFKRMASVDRFGLKVKLSSGNVASRILPLRIHDLDQNDCTLLENELGGKVRSVDFIYKSSGVNRPLSPGDNPDKNLNKTIYRDQINKLANAIKEIIQAMENPGFVKPTSASFYNVEKEIPDRRRKRRKVLTVTAGFLLLAALTFYVSFYFVIERNHNIPDKSIAVLPFDDLSQGRDQEYFSDGMMTEIIGHLSKIADLHVISRASSVAYKGKTIAVTEIAKELGVTNILSGTVQKSGNRMRISVELTDGRNNKSLWSEEYERDLKDIFAVQSDVSSRVAEILKAKLSHLEIGSLSKTSTDNPQANKLYVRGLFFMDKRTQGSYDSAEVNYKRAIELDPAYALAYSGLAECYTHLNFRGLTQLEAIPIAKAYATKALSLDSTLGEAWTTLAFIQSHYDYDWIGSKTIFEKAIRLNPNYPIAHLYYGNVFFFRGDMDAGMKETKKALELDPLSSSINWVVGREYYSRRQYDLAVRQCQKTLILDPNYWLAKNTLALSLLQNKNYSEAIDILSKLPVNQRSTYLSYAYARAGDKAKAKAEFDRILQIQGSQPHSMLAIAYIGLENFKEALAQLEQAYEAHEINMIGLKVDPILDVLRNEPRFKALQTKTNLE